MKFSSVATALLMTASWSTNAFAPASRSLAIARTFSQSTFLASTTDKPTTEEATATLSPSFQAARDASVSKVQAILGQTPKYAALEAPLVHFMDEYFNSLNQAAESGAKNPDGSDITASQAANQMMRTIQFGMKYGLGEKKYVFENVRHRALRGANFGESPFLKDNHGGDDDRYMDKEFVEFLGADENTDFYAAGCDFFRPSMDLEKSLILGVDNMAKALEQLKKGENVVFLANHQSEADPQVVSCLFEKAGKEYGDLASHITYVAGHKVTTDPLAIPFSMGRNLLCIHSKKHIDADPETKPAKSKQNMAAMNEMLQGMKDGGMAIWVAPSGGRDRRIVSNGKIPIASFDQKTVDMFRLMGNKSKRATHFYPMSMVSYDLCPPPDFVEAGVGEKRNVRFTPVGIKVMDEVPNVGGAEKRHLFTYSAEFECIKGYEELLKGMGMKQYMP